MSQTLLDIARQRFEQESSHAENIDAKAGSLIGYSGIISTFIGFLFSAHFVDVSAYKDLLMVGIIFSFLSIACALIILVPLKKTRDVYDVEDFIDKSINGGIPEPMQILIAIQNYNTLIGKTEKRNSTKSKILYAGNILLGIGLVISFVSIFLK